MQVFVVSVTLLCGYLIWEIFFYNGRLPSGMRYDFPFRLLPTLIIGAFASFLVTVFPSKAGWWRAASLLVLGLIATWRPTNFNFWALYDQAAAEVLRTNKYRSELDELADKAKSHPNWPIVLEAHNAWDWEPVKHFDSWSIYKGIQNPVVLLVKIPAETTMTPLQATLVQEMKVWATQGWPGHFVPFENLSHLVAGGRCFVASSITDPNLSQCNQQHFTLFPFK